MIDGERVDALKYTNGGGGTCRSSERQRRDPAYVAWFAALLDACGDSVPAYWDDYTDDRSDGQVWIGTDRLFPLPE